ncbi:MAG: sialidase family protein [Planctomycetota bacterium]
MLLASALLLLGPTPTHASRPPAQGAPEPALVAVWTSGEDGYHTYRIPAIVRAPSGDLLAFCEGRRGGRGDSGDIDLLVKRSSNGGATWGPQRVLWDDGENVCGNPCPVVDGTTGRIHLLATHNLGEDSEREIIDDVAEGTRTVWVLTSDDGGATWTEPREITKSTKMKYWTWYATGPGVGIQLIRGAHPGRLVVPCDHIEAGTKRYRSHVLLSDDHGKTWRIGGVTPRDQLNECQVAELADGSLVLNMRNYDRRTKARAVAVSTNGGTTWGAVRWDEALPEPICQAGLIGVDRGEERRLYFTNPASADARVRMTLRASDDGGATWETVDVLHEGPAAYSCPVALEGERVGILFECGDEHPYERIVFTAR